MDEVMTNYISAIASGQNSQANCHHLITLSYPDDNLLRDGEVLSVPLIFTAAKRYEPSSLTKDAAVTANAFRDSLEETRFYLLSSARLGGELRDFKDCRRPVRGNIDHLQEDVKNFLPWSGCTSINFITVDKKGSHGETVGYIRILRKTILLTTDGRTKEYERLYLARLQDWDAFRPNQNFISQMEQLMMGYSDRAVLHIDAALRCQGRPPCEPAKWKKPRKPQYGAVIEAVANGVDSVDLEAEDRTCPLCCCSFDEPQHDAVALHCNEKHLLCRHCLVRCCQTEANKTRCPFCRSPVFTDEETLEWLKTGALGKSYDADPQYNEWENHERSIADLDKQHADSSRALLKISSRLLKDTWNVLLKWEEAEPTQSTPRHLNPACAAGGTVVTKAFETMVDQLHGMEFQTDMVFEHLMTGLRSAIQAPSAGGLSLVPGYEACIRRRVSRTLQFAHVRGCECTQRRYHYHGLRKYYNKDYFGGGFCRPQ